MAHWTVEFFASLPLHATILLFALLCGHALADRPLQPRFVSLAKNHQLGIPGFSWYEALFLHGLVHAAFVAVLTQRLSLGAAELLCHMAIDYSKCAGRLTNLQDQVAHAVCKVLWVALVCYPV